MNGFEFAYPYMLLLLALIPPVSFYCWRMSRKNSIVLSSFLPFKLGTNGANSPVVKQNMPKLFPEFIAALPIIFRTLALILIVLGAARPRIGQSESQRKTLGLDIMLVIDTSGSMKALDLKYDGKRQSRLFVLKKVLREFIQKRSDDRLGMIVFGTQAFTQAPLTLDHDVLDFFIEQTEIGMAGENTAIGDALATAVTRLKDLKKKEKVVILLTDGDNTAGSIEPMAAAEAAKAFGVKVYTIGLGTRGIVPFPVGNGRIQQVRVSFDDKSLKEIASRTQGKYFYASSTEELEDVYNTIDKLEKSEEEIKVFQRYDEKFALFVWGALVLLLLEYFLKLSPLRRVP